MNGEEKIVHLIQELSDKVSTIQEGQDKLIGRFDTLEGRFDTLEESHNKLSETVTDLRLHIENVTDKNIQILMEQYIPNVEKLDRVTQKVDRIEIEVDNIKKVVISHSIEINELMKQK